MASPLSKGCHLEPITSPAFNLTVNTLDTMKLVPPNITPGPWKLSPDALYRRGHLVRDDDGRGFVVAACDFVSNSRAAHVNQSLEANAQAIAALPDVLQALERILVCPALNMGELEPEDVLAITGARDALTKAGYTIES